MQKKFIGPVLTEKSMMLFERKKLVCFFNHNVTKFEMKRYFPGAKFKFTKIRNKNIQKVMIHEKI